MSFKNATLLNFQTQQSTNIAQRFMALHNQLPQILFGRIAEQRGRVVDVTIAITSSDLIPMLPDVPIVQSVFFMQMFPVDTPVLLIPSAFFNDDFIRDGLNVEPSRSSNLSGYFAIPLSLTSMPAPDIASGADPSISIAVPDGGAAVDLSPTDLLMKAANITLDADALSAFGSTIELTASGSMTLDAGGLVADVAKLLVLVQNIQTITNTNMLTIGSVLGTPMTQITGDFAP